MPALKKFDTIYWTTEKCPHCGKTMKTPVILLSHPTRISLFNLIREGEITLTEAAKKLGTVKQNLTKNHIAVLKALGVIEVTGGGPHREEVKLRAVPPREPAQA